MQLIMNQNVRLKIKYLITKTKYIFFFILVKQTLIQSGIENANQLNVNEQKAIIDLEKIRQVKIFI